MKFEDYWKSRLFRLTIEGEAKRAYVAGQDSEQDGYCVMWKARDVLCNGSMIDIMHSIYKSLEGAKEEVRRLRIQEANRMKRCKEKAVFLYSIQKWRINE